MTIDKFLDKYNSNKTWIVKRYACGHYHVAQQIKGGKVSKFERMTEEQMLATVLGY